MELGDEIDLWFGTGSGYSKRVQGKYVGDDEYGDCIRAEVTDPDFLDDIGWSDEPTPYVVVAHRLDETKWVQYDDFGWSPLGEIKEEEAKDGELVGLSSLKENDDTFRYIKLIKEFNDLFK